MNGELMPAQQASVSVLDHGLLYGDGVFEGIRFFNHRAFRLQPHLDRLALSARAIALSLPYSSEALADAVDRTVKAFAEPDGYLRLVVTRGVGPMGLDPRSCQRPNVFLIADQLNLVKPEVLQRGVRLTVASTRRLPPDGLDPRIKSLNYLNHILARIEANQAGADEAVLLNAAGRVAEGSAENLFIVRAGTLLTPPVTEGALDGVTRQAIVELAKQNGVAVKESPLATFDLHTADECFLTGTGAGLIPVREIDGRAVCACPGPVFQRMDRLYADLVEKETGDAER
jgi:branched-chain amino acid aminotransferase